MCTCTYYVHDALNVNANMRIWPILPEWIHVIINSLHFFVWDKSILTSYSSDFYVTCQLSSIYKHGLHTAQQWSLPLSHHIWEVRILHNFLSMESICHIYKKAAVTISIFIVLCMVREISYPKDSTEELTLLLFTPKVSKKAHDLKSKNKNNTGVSILSSWKSQR